MPDNRTPMEFDSDGNAVLPGPDPVACPFCAGTLTGFNVCGEDVLTHDGDPCYTFGSHPRWKFIELAEALNAIDRDHYVQRTRRNHRMPA